MMDWSMFVCFVLVVNLASSELGASSEVNYDTEGTLPVSSGTENQPTGQNCTLYVVASSEGSVRTATEDGGLAIGIAGHGIKNSVTISDSPIQGATHVSSNGLLHIHLMGTNHQNDISYNGRPLYLAARLLDITSDGELNHNNININGIPTQDGDTGNRTNGRLRIKISGSMNVNKITVNGNPILPGDELFRIQTTGSSNTNEITFTGTNSEPQNSTSRSSGVLKISVLGTTTVNTININDRSIQPGAGLLHLYVPQQSQSVVRVNGGPWEYWNV